MTNPLFQIVTHYDAFLWRGRRSVLAVGGILTALIALPNQALAQIAPAQTSPESAAIAAVMAEDVGGRGFTLADLIGLADAASAVADVTITKVSDLRGAREAASRPGYRRVAVDAKVNSLIRGERGIATRIRYQVDVPLVDDKLPKLKGVRALIFGHVTGDRANQMQLATPTAQIRHNQTVDGRVRAIIAQLIAPGAAPRLAGVDSAYHAAGALPDEGETQIFFATTNGAPAALTISRKAGRAPSWAASFGEVMGEGSTMPQIGSINWYRLACTTPRVIPDAVIGNDAGSLSRDDVLTKVARDYAYVREQLGPCPRMQGIPIIRS